MVKYESAKTAYFLTQKYELYVKINRYKELRKNENGTA